MSYITVTNETRGTMIGDRIQVADTSLSRMVGLMGKRGVRPGGGLLVKTTAGGKRWRQRRRRALYKSLLRRSHFFHAICHRRHRSG